MTMVRTEARREPAREEETSRLARFAAVNAAQSDGFSLDEALAVEGLDRAEWQALRLEWSARVVADARAFEAYRQWLEYAEDRLARRVHPLDVDAEAWAAFLSVLAAAPDPQPVLAREGLRLADLSRLRRLWERRARGDASVARDLARAHRRAGARCPLIVVERSPLRPVAGGPR